jgi:drug/metabolite transporter (DMT)-like permease
VWGWLFFNEELGLLQVVGAALTLLAIYVGAVRGVKKAGEAEGRLETAK